MVIKGYRHMLVLIGFFTLTCAMRCDTDRTIYPIEELRNAKVYGKLTPEKEAYQVGDIIEVTLRVTSQDLNNWRHFDEAEYQAGYIFKLAHQKNEVWLDWVEVVELNSPTKPTKVANGESYIEFKVKYKLLEARTYSWGRHCWEHETGEACYSYLDVYYRDNKNFAIQVPIFFANNKQREFTIRVVE